MKNMVLLIDTNVILDYFLFREPNCNDAEELFKECKNFFVKGYVAFHSISTIWYSLRKKKSLERRKILLEVTDFLTVTSVPHEKIIEAIKQENFSDFEDCLQEKCALEINADYIVTNNVKDFKSSKIPAVTPFEMLEIFLK